VLDAAKDTATKRKRLYFSMHDLLAALVSDESSVAAGILVAAGGDLAKLPAQLTHD
jgi:hypothetical protein